jgi:hypothetical protein
MLKKFKTSETLFCTFLRSAPHIKKRISAGSQINIGSLCRPFHSFSLGNEKKQHSLQYIFP